MCYILLYLIILHNIITYYMYLISNYTRQHCNMSNDIVWYNIVWYNITSYIISYYTIKYYIIKYHYIQHCIIWCKIIYYNIYNKISYYTVSHYMIQNYNFLIIQRKLESSFVFSKNSMSDFLIKAYKTKFVKLMIPLHSSISPILLDIERIWWLHRTYTLTL